jgi:hypothetical protein
MNNQKVERQKCHGCHRCPEWIFKSLGWGKCVINALPESEFCKDAQKGKFLTLYLLLLMTSSALYAGDINNLIPALIEVESRGNDNAIGDNGKAFGCLQVWDICVQDVNRVYKTSYTHKQMMDRYTACEVCYLYLLHWGQKYCRRRGIKDASYEVLARIWNGGPRGYQNPKTEEYWTKVKPLLK